MKIAEALSERAALISHIQNVAQRMSNSSTSVDGEEPIENIGEVMEDFNRSCDELENLIVRINRSNLATHVESGMTLTEALARRDRYAIQLPHLERVMSHMIYATANRTSKDELRIVRLIDANELRRQMDAMAKARRDLDSEIQAANWSNELLD